MKYWVKSSTVPVKNLALQRSTNIHGPQQCEQERKITPYERRTAGSRNHDPR
jgi:hypothetical protein